MTRRALALAAAVLAAAPLSAQSDSTRLTVARIYSSQEFAPQQLGPVRWLDGSAYVRLERPEGNARGRDVVRYDAATGARSVLVPAARFTPAGDSVPLTIESYEWSADRSKLLIFTNSQPVWRDNTRGDFWVLDVSAGAPRKLGGRGPASTMMFAKFSPDGGRLGFVRYGESNLYVEDLASGQITQLTSDGSRTTINGTFDWVYEEELGLRDGWRWSADGRLIAYWQLDATGVRDFTLINDTDSLYSYQVPVQYPKAGETNSAGRVGVVSASGGPTTWIAVPGEPRDNYIARMEWAPVVAGGAAELVIQHMNRLQNTLHVMFADPRTGAVRVALTEQDSTWVEQVDPLEFVNGGRDFVWMSERSGWNHVYLVSRDGRSVRPVTRGEWDVASYAGVDASGRWVFYTASPGNPTQRYLYRARLDGRGTPERLSPAADAGTHQYNLAPGFGFALHTYSSAGTVPTVEVVGLPAHRALRTLVDNARLKAKVAGLGLRPPEFIQVDGADGVKLNAWVIKPPNFDPAKRYPVLFHVYGGPGSQTVFDVWGGSQYLFHQMLAQRGYVIASVDNRGTGMRGRAWRKIIYGRMGVIETRDQAAAAQAFGRMPWVDSTRIGIWGWSYGGFMSLNTITQFPNVYKAAVAVAPVTHWKYYDTIYTERYLGLPQQNQAGYDAGSPLTYVNQLQGKLLVIHGSGDDNVHYQNTEAWVNALVRANKPFDLMVYPNRNHGIFSDGATPHLRELIARWLDTNLMEHDSQPAGTAIP